MNMEISRSLKWLRWNATRTYLVLGSACSHRPCNLHMDLFAVGRLLISRSRLNGTCMALTLSLDTLSQPAVALPILCCCAAARLVLDQASWPGSRACNEKTWLNDCTSQMTASVNGSSVLFTPSTSSAFNERCDPAPGVVLAPNGATAAVTFPQYPIGITSTGPDGTLTIDFSQTAADDPNQMDWSQCIVRYKIVQGTFLNPQLGTAAQQAALQALQQQQQGAGTTSGAADSRPRELLQLLIAMVGAAGLLLWL